MSITQRRAGRNIWQRTISRSTQYAEMIDVRSKLDVFNNSKVVKAAFSDEQAEKETIEKEASERIIEHQKLTKAHRDSAMRRGSLPVPARPNTAGPTTATTTTTPTTTGGTMLGESIQVYEASADMGYTHNDRQGRPSTAVSPPPGHMLPKTRRPGTSPSREQWTEDTSVSGKFTLYSGCTHGCTPSLYSNDSHCILNPNRLPHPLLPPATLLPNRPHLPRRARPPLLLHRFLPNSPPRRHPLHNHLPSRSPHRDPHRRKRRREAAKEARAPAVPALAEEGGYDSTGGTGDSSRWSRRTPSGVYSPEYCS